jgi:hypothetical protein
VPGIVPCCDLHAAARALEPSAFLGGRADLLLRRPSARNERLCSFFRLGSRNSRHDDSHDEEPDQGKRSDDQQANPHFPPLFFPAASLTCDAAPAPGDGPPI